MADAKRSLLAKHYFSKGGMSCLFASLLLIIDILMEMRLHVNSCYLRKTGRPFNDNEDIGDGGSTEGILRQAFTCEQLQLSQGWVNL